MLCQKLIKHHELKKKKVGCKSEFVEEAGETSESRATKHGEQHHNNTFRALFCQDSKLIIH